MEKRSATCVLDASALLAFLHQEPGGEIVEALLDGAIVSAVNWSEVLQKCIARGVEIAGLRDDLEALGIQVVSFTVREAELAAMYWASSKSFGLSLGDRACLAAGLLRSLPVLTADRSWKELSLDVEIKTIR